MDLQIFYRIKNKVSKLGAYELNKLGLSWGLKLKFEVDVWSWSLNLKFEVEFLSWSLKLKFEFEKNCIWRNLRLMKFQIWSWRNLKLKKIWKWRNLKLKKTEAINFEYDSWCRLWLKLHLLSYWGWRCRNGGPNGVNKG